MDAATGPSSRAHRGVRGEEDWELDGDRGAWGDCGERSGRLDSVETPSEFAREMPGGLSSHVRFRVRISVAGAGRCCSEVSALFRVCLTLLECCPPLCVMRRSSELIVADLVNGGCIDDFDQVYVLDDSLLTPFPTLFHGAARVPGLPIRDCTRGYNNRGQSRPMISAIEVTAKTFFERLYLLLGLREIALPMHPTTPTPTTIFSIFFCNFFRMAPHFFGHHYLRVLWPSQHPKLFFF